MPAGSWKRPARPPPPNSDGEVVVAEALEGHGDQVACEAAVVNDWFSVSSKPLAGDRARCGKGRPRRHEAEPPAHPGAALLPAWKQLRAVEGLKALVRELGGEVSDRAGSRVAPGLSADMRVFLRPRPSPKRSDTTNLMTVDGHHARIEYNEQTDQCRGDSPGLSGKADISGASSAELHQEFKMSAEIVLEVCKEQELHHVDTIQANSICEFRLNCTRSWRSPQKHRGRVSTRLLRKHSRDVSRHQGTDSKPPPGTDLQRVSAEALESLPAASGPR